MSPLAPTGARGYSDYQRLANFDSGVLYSLNQVVGIAGVVSPIIDMSRYAYLGGLISPQAGAFFCQFTWFADGGGIVEVGQRTIVFDINIGNSAQLRIPNLGPFLQINTASLAGNATVRTTLIGTNRVHPLELIPMGTRIMDVQNMALAANGSATLYPNDYYAGPARLFIQAGQATFWALAALSTANAWEVADGSGSGTVTLLSSNIVLPAGAWRIGVTNSTAIATTITASITPPTTGAT